MLTSFSIDDILKPDFGRKVKVKLSSNTRKLMSMTSGDHDDISSAKLCCDSTKMTLISLEKYPAVETDSLLCYENVHRDDSSRESLSSASSVSYLNSSQRLRDHVIKRCEITRDERTDINHNIILSRRDDADGHYHDDTMTSDACDDDDMLVPLNLSMIRHEVPKLPAWVYCTRYSDRPSAGPRSRKVRRLKRTKSEDKRSRTAFSNDQLEILKQEFDENKYLTDDRKRSLAKRLDLHESQIKIWFQNKRAKQKKLSGVKNSLALELMAQGLYNHSTASQRNSSDST